MNTPYVPISCDVHDELLSAATLRKPCRLTVALADGQSVRIDGVIADVYTREGAEYLQLHDGTTYRLDQIRELDGKPIARR
ncbi:hypothetical protein E4K72_07795 [Oxalobacteraceae bacterium OM1]|nr:hypothetical protein E4K72_07795 [Oxalobacteraceae bacterium OM1]